MKKRVLCFLLAAVTAISLGLPVLADEEPVASDVEEISLESLTEDVAEVEAPAEDPEEEETNDFTEEVVSVLTEEVGPDGASGNAAFGVTIAADKTTLQKKGTVTFTLSASNPSTDAKNSGLYALMVKLVYDTDEFTVVEDSAKCVSTSSFSDDVGTGLLSGDTFIWCSTTPLKLSDGGKFFSFTLQANDDAEAASYNVNVEVTAAAGYDSPYKATVTNPATAATVKVSSIVYGDVDGNGSVNNADLLRLLRYFGLKNGKTTVHIEAGADCDGNGSVNNADLLRLLRYFGLKNGKTTIVLGPTK